jgi:hypothetical protein
MEFVVREDEAAPVPPGRQLTSFGGFAKTDP